MPTSLGLGTVSSLVASNVTLNPVSVSNLGRGAIASRVQSSVNLAPKNTIWLDSVALSQITSKVEGKLGAYAKLGQATVSSQVVSTLGRLILTPPVVEPSLDIWVAKADSPNTRVDLDGYSLALGDSLTAGLELKGERLTNLTLTLEAIDVASGLTVLSKSTGGQGITLSQVLPDDGRVERRSGYFTLSDSETAGLGETTTQLQLVFRVSDGQGYRYTLPPVTINLYKL